MASDQSPSLPAFSDKHTIETPEQMPLEFALAGIGSRFLAMAIDTLIQAVFVLLGIIALLVASRYLHSPRQGLWLVAGFISFVFLVSFAYFAGYEILWNGQTPGKRSAGIRVIKDSGRPLTAAETIGRNFLRIVDQLPAFYAVGVLAAFLNSRNKRLGDFIAGSIVIREGSIAEFKPAWQAAAAAAPASATALFSREDLDLIEAFLNRRHSLTPDVRSRIASEILARIRSKLPAQATPESRSAESILESLASHGSRHGRG